MLRTVVTVVWTLGLGMVVTGAIQNAVARFTSPRPPNDRSLGGIHDMVVRRAGPVSLRTGAALLVVTTPLLVFVWR